MKWRTFNLFPTAAAPLSRWHKCQINKNCLTVISVRFYQICSNNESFQPNVVGTTNFREIWDLEWRILVTCALSLGQAVLITDSCHQILEACDPGPCLLSSARDQVQRLHMFSIVEAEATVGVEAPLCISLEDLWLFPLTNLTDGVDGN